MAQLTFTVKEAAEALGLCERTIYELVYKKQIPFRRIEARGKHKQGKILFSVKALEEWLAGEVKPAEAEAPEKKSKLKLAGR